MNDTSMVTVGALVLYFAVAYLLGRISVFKHVYHKGVCVECRQGPSKHHPNCPLGRIGL